MLWTALLKTKQTKKKTAATFDRHMTEDNIRPVYRHFLLRGIILPSLSHASQTWLIKFHSGARCNYTHARTHAHANTKRTHTHTHKNSICVISDVVFQNHILQQIEIGCVGKAEGLEDGHFVLVRIPPRCSWPECLFPSLWRSKRRCACWPCL